MLMVIVEMEVVELPAVVKVDVTSSVVTAMVVVDVGVTKSAFSTCLD
jgi:hypothetical protein